MIGEPSAYPEFCKNQIPASCAWISTKDAFDKINIYGRILICTVPWYKEDFLYRFFQYSLFFILTFEFMILISVVNPGIIFT
ncbi:MAG: hypothetical protein ACM339_00710 [Ignavibacteria bacterium]